MDIPAPTNHTMREVCHKAVIQIVCIVSALKHIIASFAQITTRRIGFGTLIVSIARQTFKPLLDLVQVTDFVTDGWMDGQTNMFFGRPYTIAPSGQLFAPVGCIV